MTCARPMPSNANKVPIAHESECEGRLSKANKRERRSLRACRPANARTDVCKVTWSNTPKTAKSSMRNALGLSFSPLWRFRKSQNKVPGGTRSFAIRGSP